MLLRRKTLGLILVSVGGGMLVMVFLPGWGCLLALTFLILGVFILNSKKC